MLAYTPQERRWLWVNSILAGACWLVVLGFLAYALVGCFTIKKPDAPQAQGWFSWFQSKASVGGPGDYQALDWVAGWGTALAFILFLASVAVGYFFPVGKIGTGIRAVAGASIGCAVGAWILKFLLVKYLPLAVGILVLCALIAAGLYVFGHRKLIERLTGVDLTKDNLPAGVEKNTST